MSRARIVVLLTILAGVGLAAAWAQGRFADETSAPPVTPTHGPACRVRSFEETRFTVCKFDARVDRVAIVHRGPSGWALRGFAALERALGARAAEVRFAVNGGMFDEAGAPIGLFVEDGARRRGLNRREGGGNFHLLPNGVFAQDAAGRVHVSRSEDFTARVPHPRWATQSGPMLVADGRLHPGFDADGRSKLVRNGVGVSDPHTAWFAISEEGVSFGRFARLFRDELDCSNALFLDGSVSSLWNPAGGRQDGHAELGPMIVVSRP